MAGSNRNVGELLFDGKAHFVSSINNGTDNSGRLLQGDNSLTVDARPFDPKLQRRDHVSAFASFDVAGDSEGLANIPGILRSGGMNRIATLNECAMGWLITAIPVPVP